MRYLYRGLGLAIALVGLVGPASMPAEAAEFSNSEFVIVPEGDLLVDDLYAGAVRVVIDGTLDGDLVAAAAEEVVIRGQVTGSVMVVAPRVVVEGEILGTLRAATRTLEVSGSVGGDIVAISFDSTLETDAVVGGNVVMYSWSAGALGSIEGSLEGGFRRLELAGKVGGDVDVTVDRFTVVDSLAVDGDLGYRSDHEAIGIDRAAVTGTIVEKTPLEPNLRVRALRVFGRFMVVLFLTLSALLCVYGWPERGARAIGEVAANPVRHWLRGASVVFAPLVLVAIAGLIVTLAPAAAAFPLLLVMIPLILATAGLTFAVALFAGAPVAGWLGGTLWKRFDLYGSLVAGSALLGALWLVPWVGLLLPVIVLPLGLGSWMAAMRS